MVWPVTLNYIISKYSCIVSNYITWTLNAYSKLAFANISALVSVNPHPGERWGISIDNL